MRLVLTFTLLLGGLSPLFAQEAEPAPPEEGVPAPVGAELIAVEAGEVAVPSLVQQWARMSGRLPIIDADVAKLQVRFPEAGQLDVPTLQRVLDFHDVVVVEQGALLIAYHRRNLAQSEGPPWEPVLTDPAEVPQENRIVTAVLNIEHGAGNSIFATVRGLLTRDTNRIGNILYVQGPEVIILVDLAPKVRYYAEVIRRMDRPQPTHRLELRLVEMPRQDWAELSAQPEDAELADAIDLALAEGKATLWDAARVPALQGMASLERSVELGEREEARFEFQTRSVAPAGAEGVVVSLGGGGSLELTMDLSVIRAGRVALRRRLRAALPRNFADDRCHVFAFAGREGAAPTQLVAVIRGLRR